MRINEGSLDRAVRVTVGIQMLALALSKSVTGAAGVAMLGVGAVLLVTGTMGFCLLYRALGWSTVAKPMATGGPATSP